MLAKIRDPNGRSLDHGSPQHQRRMSLKREVSVPARRRTLDPVKFLFRRRNSIENRPCIVRPGHGSAAKPVDDCRLRYGEGDRYVYGCDRDERFIAYWPGEIATPATALRSHRWAGSPPRRSCQT